MPRIKFSAILFIFLCSLNWSCQTTVRKPSAESPSPEPQEVKKPVENVSFNCEGSIFHRMTAPKIAWSSLSGFMVGPSALSQFKNPDEKILRPFTTDGCSLSPDGAPSLEQFTSWQDCCVAHDTAYWLGGAKTEKNIADSIFKKCIADKKFNKIANIYKFFVQIFGGPETGTTFRWGYGWNYKRPYGPISRQEYRQVEEMYGNNIYDIKKLLFESYNNVVKTCDIRDYALMGFNDDERVVYQYLNLHLKKNDRISWARPGYSNLKQKDFILKLDGCNSPITFVIARDSGEIIQAQGSCSP